MKKYTKHLLLVAFLFLFFQVPAQTKQYKPKKERTLKAQAVEKEVQAFIEKNIDKYDLTPERVARLNKNAVHGEGLHIHEEVNFNDLVLAIKKKELRKLYFKNNPKVESYYRTTIDSLPDICDNGGFEDGVTDEYSFTHDDMGGGVYNSELDSIIRYEFNCEMISEAVTPATALSVAGIFNGDVVLADNDETTASGYDITLDQAFNNLNPRPPSVSRVHSGNYSIKLNDSEGHWYANSDYVGISSMTKIFTVNSDFVSYWFSLIVQYPDHVESHMPHFVARLKKLNNEVVSSTCIVSDIRDTEMFYSVNYNSLPLLYTDWQCARLPTEGFAEGETAILEFIITDCTETGHFGTVYIDDICDGSFCPSAYGEIDLDLIDPALRDCPSFPIQICGTYSPPHAIDEPEIVGVFEQDDGLTLEILQNGVAINTLNDPIIDTVNQTFCFEISEADFITNPLGEYEFRANASFIVGTSTNPHPWDIFDESANVGADITFDNCGNICPECITATVDINTGIDHQQANVCINANNTISGIGTEVVYRAGKEVVLLDGFDALIGTKDRFHIEGCTTNNYVARTADPSQTEQYAKDVTIDLIERTANSSISIYPNPTNGELSILSNDASVKTLTLFGLDGKVVLKQQAADADAHSYNLNLNAVAAGIYLLSIEAEDGTVTSHKIIKN